MSKKTPPRPSGEDKPAKEVLYLELDAALKQRLRRLAELPHRQRKITAEATIALLRYVEEEERKEGISPPEDHKPARRKAKPDAEGGAS